MPLTTTFLSGAPFLVLLFVLMFLCAICIGFITVRSWMQLRRDIRRMEYPADRTSDRTAGSETTCP